MKFTDVFTTLLKKKEDGTEYIFSLYIDVDSAAVAVWHIEGKNTPVISSFAHGLVREDTWEARIQVVDRLLSAAEDKVGSAKAVTKTVFGLPGAYLTAEGNISDPIQPQLRKLTKLLELTAVGFVPLTQAIVYQLTKEEGVPSSVILVGCAKQVAHVTVFRVGKMTHEEAIQLGEDPAMTVEATLKTHQDGDVLPSRILLYGGDSASLESIRTKLLKHPWPTRANFMHFPKIEIISVENLLTAVSLAGASELAAEMSAEAEAPVASTVVAQPQSAGSISQPVVPNESFVSEDVHESEVVAPEDAPSSIDEELVEEEMPASGEDDESPEDLESTAVAGETEFEHIASENDEVSNVEMVTPESLGFHKEDVLAHPNETIPHTAPTPKQVRREELEEAMYDDEEPEEAKTKFSLPFKLPAFSLHMFTPVKNFFSGIRIPKMGGMIPLIAGGVGIISIIGLLMYFLPHVTVTILVSPQSVDESAVLGVNATATIADPSSKIIPGQKLEKSISGEKTIAVTGKKNIGDPAKGTVVIYNKVTSSKTFPKGTAISANSLTFTLDSDVTVASASESIGSITFGKATANVTAKDIGPNGNLPSGTEFAFTGSNASQASARSDAAFTGGTSKQITVVSRADQDALVKALTDDLVGQAKAQLLASATGGQRLIDQTIKTAVTDKTFDQEVDQQAKELHGKVTITVSGLSVSDEDIKAILTSLVSEKVPSGYELVPNKTEVAVSNVTVKKDQSISITAKLTATTLPKLDIVEMKKQLVGKDVTTASSILKQSTGVAGVEYRFSFSPIKTRLPLNSNNITLTVMSQ